MNAYLPRRCSKRWLDADCPREVLAILDHPRELDRYTIMFVPEPVPGYTGRHMWVEYLSVTESGSWAHGGMFAYEAANYRYHNKHRYIRWSDLPVAVQRVVRADLGSTEGNH